MVDWNGGVGTFATKRLKGLIFTRMNFLKTKVNEHLEMVSPPPMLFAIYHIARYH